MRRITGRIASPASAPMLRSRSAMRLPKKSDSGQRSVAVSNGRNRPISSLVTSFGQMRVIAVFWMFLLGAGWLDAQVVLSQRVYAEHGRTWRQLCSREGKLIYFVSDRDGVRSLNAYAGANDRELWAFDRQTGQERLVWQTSDDEGLHLNGTGTTAGGGVLIHVGMELRNPLRHPWSISKTFPTYHPPAAVSPDGRALAIVIAGSFDIEGQSHDAKLFIVDTATGQSRVAGGEI
jgi:hypothetical protein